MTDAAGRAQSSSGGTNGTSWLDGGAAGIGARPDGEGTDASAEAVKDAVAGEGSAPSDGGADSGDAQDDADESEHFSFFVTSLRAIQRLSGRSSGFGGDLRFGKTDGLSGADEICRQIAEASLPGSGAKGWRAFLSVTKGPSGMPVHAADRIGEGPWYDRLGRLVAASKADLLQMRPRGADPLILNDLPNEDGVPNHNPENMGLVDNHDMLTGTDASGHLYDSNWSCTCHDWTSSVGKDGRPRVGHSWPRSGGIGSSMAHWISALDEAGCGAGINLVETGPPDPSNPIVGSGGGYGGFYCLSLQP